jgi:putative transposase
MREWQSQAHVKWYCRSHVVIVPKYGRKAVFRTIRRDMGQILKELCRRFDSMWNW